VDKPVDEKKEVKFEPTSENTEFIESTLYSPSKIEGNDFGGFDTEYIPQSNNDVYAGSFQAEAEEYRSQTSDGYPGETPEEAEIEVIEDQDAEALGFREESSPETGNQFLKSITEEGTVYSDNDRRDSLI